MSREEIRFRAMREILIDFGAMTDEQDAAARFVIDRYESKIEDRRLLHNPPPCCGSLPITKRHADRGSGFVCTVCNGQALPKVAKCAAFGNAVLAAVLFNRS